MKLFDAHNHLNSQLFDQQWEEVVRRAGEKGVVGMINNAGDLSSSRRGIEQAEAVEGVWATVGVHPEDLPLKSELVEQVDELRRLALSSKKVVAIGELGLDYTLEHDDSRGVDQRQEQMDLIEPQLALAEELGLPVVLHVRDVPGGKWCFEDIIGLLKNFRLKGQLHCWTGGVSEMEKVLALEGMMISFSGILTYGSAGSITEVARLAPADRILVETDGPYLVPEPRRTEMRREGLRNSERLCLPEHVIMTAEKLADLRQAPVEEIARVTTSNAYRLFGLSPT